MSTQKTIAVVGATGAQGGGLVRAILADKSGRFKARALTRDPTPTRRKGICGGGSRSGGGNVDDVESLKAERFRARTGVFCVTFFCTVFANTKRNRRRTWPEW